MEQSPSHKHTYPPQVKAKINTHIHTVRFFFFFYITVQGEEELWGE